ncbi:MAG: malate dehydrogenase [Arcobacteraceae bacterium]
MAKTKQTTDLKPYNLSYFENGFTFKLLLLKKDKMIIDVAIFKNNQFLKNDTKPFAQIPKNLKVKINPL